MIITSKPNTTRYQVRSISLPCRSHPSTIRLEQELNKLKTWEASPSPTEKSVCDGLIGLAMLYICVNDLLNLSSTREALFRTQKEKWVDVLLDGSVRILDICGMARETVSQIVEQIRNLQCALRRRKGDWSIESNVANYATFRKKTKKDAKRLVAELKQVNNNINARSPELNLDPHVIALIRVLFEVNELTVSVFESVWFYFTTSGIKPKPTKWSLVSKLIQKGKISCDDQPERVNDMVNVDVASLNLCRNIGSSNEVEKLQIAKKRLKAFEAHIESINNGLECMYRHLIRTRASLLNITSH